VAAPQKRNLVSVEQIQDRARNYKISYGKESDKNQALFVLIHDVSILFLS